MKRLSKKQKAHVFTLVTDRLFWDQRTMKTRQSERWATYESDKAIAKKLAVTSKQKLKVKLLIEKLDKKEWVGSPQKRQMRINGTI